MDREASMPDLPIPTDPRLSLREYYAGIALGAIIRKYSPEKVTEFISNYPSEEEGEKAWEREVGRTSVAYADALLAELAKEPTVA